MIDQAVILAAGEGQRLRPFTALRPKVMLPIANRPILSYVVEAVARKGIRNIVMVVGYKKEQVQDYFGSGDQFGVNITYVTQRHQVGTGQALKVAQDVLGGQFMVLPGDNIIEPATIEGIMNARPPTMLVKRSENSSKYGVVLLDNGLVKKVTEKPREPSSNLVNTGIYVLGQEIFEFLQDQKDLTSALQQIASSDLPLYAHETSATWLDVVYPWDILTLNGVALEKTDATTGGTIEPGCTIKGPVHIAPGSIIRANSYLVGPLIIGEGCEIGPSVCLLPSTSIGDNVTISPFSYITNSVIGNNVRIGPASCIQDCVIGSHTVLGARFSGRTGPAVIPVESEYHHVNMGAMVGDGCEIDDGVVVQPGVIIGNYCRVRPLKVISESLADRSLVA